MTFLTLLLGSLSTAYAVPVQLSQQGRLLDSAGVAISGMHLVDIRLFDDQSSGSMVWDESLQVYFENGYYSLILGDSSSNPLDDSVLAGQPLFLEIEVDNQGPIGFRQPVVSSPYSRFAGTAENLSGGTVDASIISVGGQQVIDSSGSWVGPAMQVSWSSVQGIPADLADGDDDSLAGISCAAGQVLGWDGSQWGCAADNGLTEAEVEAFVTNGPLDLDGGTTIGGLPILTQGDGGTLSGLSCQSGDVAKYDSVLGWTCDIDLNTADWSTLNGIPSDLADGDDVLSESDVEGYVTNGSLDLAAGTSLNGKQILATVPCNPGEIAKWDGVEWVCADFELLLDGDQDGVYRWDDCDDNDPNSLSVAQDGDCDGTVTAGDCNDNDPNSTIVATDADCDGVLSADDCDDNDPASTTVATDFDCDGTVSALDCDDADPNSNTVATDADCDGLLTADDCDDNDPNSYSVAQDGDCDGVLGVASGCSSDAEYEYEIVPGMWACVNNSNITSDSQNSAMCNSGFVPPTYDLVNSLGLAYPTAQQHSDFFNWYSSLSTSGDIGYIRTGQKRRNCQQDLYVAAFHNVNDNAGGWGDLYYGGSSCSKDTNSANTVAGHPLAGVVCVSAN